MDKIGLKFLLKNGTYYSDVINTNILKIVKLIKSKKARFITATCFQNADQFLIYYHFEASKHIYTLKTVIKNDKAKSISSVYPTASWIEREITDLYGIEFQGKEYKPLLLTPEFNHPFREN